MIDQAIYQQFKAKFDAAEAEGLRALKNLSDPDPEVRFQAAQWIAKQSHRDTSNTIEIWLANKRATAALTDALRDADERVVEEAALALSHVSYRYCADPRAFSALLPLLQSQRPKTRQFAVMAAAMVGGEKSLPHVLPLVADPIATVRQLAIYALHYAILPEWEEKQWVPPPHQQLPLDGPTSAQSLKQVCEALLPALQDKVVLVRDNAANILGRIGDESVLPHLEKASRKERRAPAKDTMKMAVERLKKRLQV